jgi:Uma2 family endonuclease
MIRFARSQTAARFRPGALGPRDAGRTLTEPQYLRCTDAPGYVCEIFDGVVQVSPSPVPIHSFWENALYDHLSEFSSRHRESFNYVARDNDVVIPGRPGVTRPRPDLTACRDFPGLEGLARMNDWSYFCPVLVVEVVSSRRRRKDVERNRALYWAAGGIAEYWIVDPSRNPKRPALIVHTREAGRPTWTEQQFPFGRTYESRMPGGLKVNLRALAARR